MNSSSPTQPTTLRRSKKIVISVAVVVHLWAVVAEPIRFSTCGPGGPSPAASTLRYPVGAYSELAYLSHGYAFFAPDPGPSHLVRASWTDKAADSQSLTFPDLDDQWPRLLYHRHFMLSEFLHNAHQPPSLPPDVPRDSELFREWRRARAQYESLRDSYAQHLARTLDVDSVSIERIEHRMPGIPEFLEEGIGLQHQRLYQTLPDGVSYETLPPLETQGP